jgi:hypothetical protein
MIPGLYSDNLFIEIKDGQPINHPLVATNLIHIHDDFDVNNPPEKYVPFIRHPQPVDLIPTAYQIVDSTYQLSSDGTYCEDFWYVRDMTDDEKYHREQSLIENANLHLTEHKIQAKHLLENSTDDFEKEKLQNYLTALEEIVITDPLNVEVPNIPYKNEDGVWITTSTYRLPI